jgi:hypothetical protein
MRKLRLRKVKSLTQGHPAKRHSPFSELNCFSPKISKAWREMTCADKGTKKKALKLQI